MLVSFALSHRLPSTRDAAGFRRSRQGHIFLCVGRDIFAAIQVFCKWAVPVSWLLINKDDNGKRAIEPVSKHEFGALHVYTLETTTAGRADADMYDQIHTRCRNSYATAQPLTK